MLRPTTVFAVFVCTLLLVPVGAVAQADTIDAVVRGTSTQMGREINIKIVVNHFSAPQDKQELQAAYNQGQNDGLVKALAKMKAAGQLQIQGNVGYDLAYISSTPTPTGHRIRFVTNRRIAFFEALLNTPSQAYDLTAGEVDINDQNPKQSTGVLYPATQLNVNKEGDLEWDLHANPWQMTNIIDWNAKKKG